MYIMATQEDGKNPSAGDSPEWVMVVLHVKCVFAVDDAVPYITLMKWLPSTVREVIVYKSIATNVFANLALEDWIFQHVDLSARRVLFLWRNSPCVVIGRHQNPWVEANVPLLRERGVALARRRSGGGAVYHDLGNLNITVFTHRHDYHRPRNLELVCDAINEEWNTGLHRNKRDDIVYDGRLKVSGSSARLTKNSAYHHFTLLLNVDKASLRSSLQSHPQLQPSNSIATNSERSDVINICTLNPGMAHEAVSAAIAEKFYDVHKVRENKQVIEVNPLSESDFPGVTKLQEELQQWEWVYGKTPKFSISASGTFQFGQLELTANLVGGVLWDVSLRAMSGPSGDVLEELAAQMNGKRLRRADIASCLGTSRYSDHSMRDIITWITQLS